MAMTQKQIKFTADEPVVEVSGDGVSTIVSGAPTTAGQLQLDLDLSIELVNQAFEMPNQGFLILVTPTLIGVQAGEVVNVMVRIFKGEENPVFENQLTKVITVGSTYAVAGDDRRYYTLPEAFLFALAETVEPGTVFSAQGYASFAPSSLA
ncbi:MAG: hypothetical protein ATN35_08615 [Epulopiscium sp. Nele67-Bin004]|nr:MAG: hypothetical protein ATN35_08615 [Epulopiscium sp. Nele67-Bin004]